MSSQVHLCCPSDEKEKARNDHLRWTNSWRACLYRYQDSTKQFATFLDEKRWDSLTLQRKREKKTVQFIKAVDVLDWLGPYVPVTWSIGERNISCVGYQVLKTGMRSIFFVVTGFNFKSWRTKQISQGSIFVPWRSWGGWREFIKHPYGSFFPELTCPFARIVWSAQCVVWLVCIFTRCIALF